MKKRILTYALALLSFTSGFAQNLLNDPDFTLSTTPVGWYGWNGAGINPVTQILSIDGDTATFTPLSDTATVLNDAFASWTGNQLIPGTYTFSIDVTEVTSDGSIMLFASWQDNTWSPAGAGKIEVPITGPGTYTVEISYDAAQAYFNQVGISIEGWTSGSVSFKNPSLTVENFMNDPDLTLATNPGGWYGWDGAGVDPVTKILSVDGTSGTFTPLSDVKTNLNDAFAPWSNNQLAAGDYYWSVDVTEVTSDGTITMYASWQDSTWTPAGAGIVEKAITEPGTYIIHFSLNEGATYFDQVGFSIEGWTSGSISFENPALTSVPSNVPTWAGYPVMDMYVDTADWMGWLYVGDMPWIYCLNLNKYIYLPEPSADSTGSWAYVPR